MRVCKHGCDVSDLRVSNRALFACSQSLVFTLEGLGEFSRVMQVLGLHKHGKSALLLKSKAMTVTLGG